MKKFNRNAELNLKNHYVKSDFLDEIIGNAYVKMLNDSEFYDAGHGVAGERAILVEAEFVKINGKEYRLDDILKGYTGLTYQDIWTHHECTQEDILDDIEFIIENEPTANTLERLAETLAKSLINK